MKKFFLWLGCAIATPVVLFVLLTILIYIPAVQSFLVHKSAEYASKELGMQVSVDNVRIAFPLDLELNGFLAVQDKDTLLDVEHLVVDVPVRPLLDKEVQLKGLQLKGVKVNTLDWIDAVQISGNLNYLGLNSHGILLDLNKVIVQDAQLNGANLLVQVRDSVPEDTTTSEPSPWKIDLQKADLQDTHFRLLIDSLDLRVGVGEGQANQVQMILGESLYKVGDANLARSSFALDLAPGKAAEGFDYSHIALDSISIKAQSIVNQGSFISLDILEGALKERCGVKINELSGHFQMDSLAMHAANLKVATPYTSAQLDADVDLNALDDQRSDGKMQVAMKGSVGRTDVFSIIGPTLAKDLKSMYPNRPLVMDANITGNLRKMQIQNTRVSLDGALTASLNGELRNITDDKHRSGSIKLNAKTQQLDFLMKMLDLGDYRIPRGMIAKGNLTFNGPKYGFKGLIQEGKGSVKVDGSYNLNTDEYQADVQARDLNISHFMPKDSIYLFSGDLVAQGKGTDIYSPKTKMNLQAQVTQLQYGANDFQGIGADLNLADHLLAGSISSDNDCLQMTGDIDGYVQKDSAWAKLNLDVDKLDLQQMKVTADSMVWAFHVNAEAETNVKDVLAANMIVDDISVATKNRTYTPKLVDMDLLLRPDSVFGHVDSGDFYLDLQSKENLDSLLSRSDELQKIVLQQLEQKHFSITALQKVWPDVCLKMHSGNDNPICNLLTYMGYSFKQMSAHFDASPDEGLDGNMYVYGLMADSILLDTVRMSVEQQDTMLVFKGQVQNNKHNPQFVFNAYFRGHLLPDGATSRIVLFDAKNKVAANLGAQAQLVQGGCRFTINPDNPFLAYKVYHMQPNDYVMLHDDMRVEGNLTFMSDDGMGLIFKASPQETEQQNMQLQLCNIDMDELTGIIPYLPKVTGVLNGKLVASQPLDGSLTANGALKFKNLTYEGSPMGEDIELALNYTPKDANVHQLVGTLRRNGEFVTTVGGDYNGTTGEMELETILYRFPADMVNGFIPDHIAGMRGIMEGNFRITGDTNHPIINGTLTTDSVFLYSEPYAVNMRLEDRSLDIKDSRVSMKNLILYSDTQDKMLANGTVDFSNLDDIRLNMSLRANNFQIINKPRNNKTLLYGKAYVNANANVNGSLGDLRVRGDISLLGTTDVTYVLKDTPITVEDRLSDLVTFTDFNDTIASNRKVVKNELSGVDAVLTLDISEGAKVSCDLSNNRESYVDLIGGGTLVLRYTQEGKILLTGRYTINSGEMKYALPIIPLKTFTLANGSYVEFTGDMMNPKLNITATESTKASVANENGASRTVDFNVGVLITNTLSNMGLEFTIDAPKDLTVQNELASKSKEEKGKLSVAMMATGMYMSETNNSTGSGLSMNSALSSFLQSEITSIAGSALQTMDISFGVSDRTSKTGQTTTDYSFRFAKRLWGNRVSIIIGGKVSTGASYVNNGSFIDDISLEYRLDDSGTRYVRLFHDKSFDSLLDGEVQETGAGIVLRKKMTRFGELFIFRNSARRDEMNRLREEEKEAEGMSEADQKQQQEHREKDQSKLEKAGGMISEQKEEGKKNE